MSLEANGDRGLDRKTARELQGLESQWDAVASEFVSEGERGQNQTMQHVHRGRRGPEERVEAVDQARKRLKASMPVEDGDKRPEMPRIAPDPRSEFVNRALMANMRLGPGSGPASQNGMADRMAAANGLAYDMLHDAGVAKRVLKHADVEGYDPVVVNMAAHGYAALKYASHVRSPALEEHFFSYSQQAMRQSGGEGIAEGRDRNPPVTNAREMWWKVSGLPGRLARRRRDGPLGGR